MKTINREVTIKEVYERLVALETKINYIDSRNIKMIKAILKRFNTYSVAVLIMVFINLLFSLIIFL